MCILIRGTTTITTTSKQTEHEAAALMRSPPPAEATLSDFHFCLCMMEPSSLFLHACALTYLPPIMCVANLTIVPRGKREKKGVLL